MPRCSCLRSGALSVAAALVFFGMFQIRADANPGSYHTAVGSGVNLSRNCGLPGCPPSTSGERFTINASDRAGSYGWMQLNGVRISLDCVAIGEWDGPIVDGHELYASGTGTDGKTYFAYVSATAAGTGSFVVGPDAGSYACGASLYGVEGSGSFVITAV